MLHFLKKKKELILGDEFLYYSVNFVKNKAHRLFYSINRKLFNLHFCFLSDDEIGKQ